MKKFFPRIIIHAILRRKSIQEGKSTDYSRYRIASGYRELRITILRFVRDLFVIAIGIASAAFGLESFLLPNQFIDGGATGISLLIAELTGIHLSWLLVFINIPFILLAFNVISRQFAVRASLAILGLAITIATIHFPEVTHDKLLVAVFGGFFLGAGIGLSIRGGAVLDGTEVLAIFTSRKLSARVGDIIMLFNIVIFGAAAYLLNVESALYSMLTYLAAAKTLDFVIEGIEEYTGVTIISSHNEEIRQMIIEKMGRGVTVYKGKRGFGKRGHLNEVDILFTVITRLEISKLNTEIEKVDPAAFVVMNSIKDTRGGMIKKRSFKH